MRRVLFGLMILLVMGDMGWGQQVIGSFPDFDGGFENQTAGTPVTVSSIATGIQRTDWTVQYTSGTATISSTGGRSGPSYITYSATAARRLQSPTASSLSVANSTSYTIQFYYKSTAAASNGQVGVSPDGTPSVGTYVGLTLNNTSGVWTKITQSATSGTSTNTPRYGIGIIRFSAASGTSIDIDDFVMYAGAVDNTAPNSPGIVTVNNPTTSSLDVSWVAASGGVDGGGYVVVRFASNPGANDDPNQNGIYAVGNTVSGGITGAVRYIGTGTSFTDNSGLSAGTTYYYKVYTVDKAFNYSAESSGSGTTSAGNSTSSDIITANNETSNIDYASYQSSSINTTSDGIRVWSFTIRDGGGSTDADGLGTILSAVTIGKGTSNGVSSWANTIRQAALFDGTTKIASINVTGETISFTGMSGTNVTAPDDGDKTLDLYLSFETSVTDNQQFQFKITSATADGAGSTFAEANAGGAASSTTGDANRIEVTATKLRFVQQPSNVVSGVSMSPAVTVEAADANNNRDLDYTTDVSMTSTGTLSGSPVTIAPSSGLATFSALVHTAAGTGLTLTASSGSLTSAGSNTFNTVYSSASDIIETPSYSYSSNIGYHVFQEASDIQETETSIEVAGFRIRDGGASSDADNAGTILTAISFNVTNPGFIRRAALYDGSSELAETAVSGSPIVFSSFSATAPDNGTKDLTLRVSFTTNVTDNHQFRFTVSSVTASATGSGFATANGGGAQSSIAGDINRIEVTATELNISNVPASVNKNSNFTATVTAVDLNGVTDVDFTSAVSLSVGTGTGVLSTVSGLTQSLVSGVFNWTDLQYNKAETGVTIQTGNSSGLTNDISSTFDVIQAPILTENFTSLGTSGTATLPSGWRVNNTNAYSTGTTATTQAAGTTGAGVLTGSSFGGTYNFANGITGSSTERALGFLTSGSYTSPRFIFVQFTNNSGSTISSIDISFDYEKYRSGSRAFDMNFFHGSDGSSWTANSSGDQSYSADADNTTVYNPPTTISKSFTITGVNIANGNNYYLMWSYTGNGGSTNGQGLGIDNISITANESSSSFSSDIIRNTGFSEPTNIAYASYQETDLTSSSLEVARFDIRDGGGSADADALSTTLTAVTLSLSNWANVRRAAIYDGSTEISEVAVSSGTVSFNSLSGLVAEENGSKTFSLRASFNSNVTDYQQIQFRITSATADGSGSGFAASDAGGATSSITGDRNRIEVIADRLTFSNEPSVAYQNDEFNLTVSATDALGSVDADVTTSVTLTKNAGAGTLSSTVGLTQTLVSGTFSWDDLLWNTIENNVSITSTNTGGFTNDVTANFNVIALNLYTWNQTGTASYTVASNWTPTRSTPTNTDVLQFNSGTTVTVTNVPAQSIGKMVVTNNTVVNLQAGASGNTLTLDGLGSYDLRINSGSELNINGSSALTIFLNTGATASIYGSMTFSNSVHKLNAQTANSIRFRNGSSITQATGCTGNIFTNAGTGNVVIFESGSQLFFNAAGSNPFALAAPNSKVIFQSGSYYVHQYSNTPSFSGRTYANFVLDNSSTINGTGTALLTLDNIIVLQGTLNLNLTGGIHIKGNINVLNGNTLTFTPASANTITFNGSGEQKIYGTGTLTFSSNANVTINKTDTLRLERNVTLNKTLTLTNGIIKISSGNTLTISSTGNCTGGSNSSFVEGRMAKVFPVSGSSQNFQFRTGSRTNIQPVTVTLATVSGSAVTITSEQVNANPLNDLPSTSLNTATIDNISGVRYWNITKSGGSFTNAQVTLTYVSTYGNSDSVQVGSELRIAQADGSNVWQLIGGTGSANWAGTITSSTFSNFYSGYFAFADPIGGADITLPVQLAYFRMDHQSSAGIIQLTWRTESEIDNAYFLVQRMNADRQFETIAQIKGQGSKTSATDYEFIDENVQSGDTLVYRLADVAYDGTITYHEPKTLIVRLPARFDLLPNYPNPFNPSTTIVYHLPQTGDVTVRIYNALGQRVKTLVSRKDHAPGIHRLQWDGRNDSGVRAGSGLYIVRIQTNHFSKSRKILLLK